MRTQLLNHAALQQALHLRDLSDERQGPHALQLILGSIHSALARQWACRRLIYRANPVVTVEDNYDSLGYPPEGAARDSRYSRYVTDRIMLRSQTSASIPAALRSLALDPPDDLLIVSPGLVYRRDVIDRLHVGEPHQVDLWRLSAAKLGEVDLAAMIDTVVKVALPGVRYRTTAAPHPYTKEGRQIDAQVGDEWVEIGECGLADPEVLQRCGIDPASHTGLAMGLGLDRLLLLRKGIVDIRLLREEDPRVATQMLDLAPYRPVSRLPAIIRDLSLAVSAALTPEELGDRIRMRLPHYINSLEAVDLVTETPYEMLPASARLRMGMLPGQKNVLLRIVARHPLKTLTSAEANAIRNEIYLALHEGEKSELAPA